jgi:hypothetical protein
MKAMGVLWSEAGSDPHTGKLRLAANGIEFVGRELRSELPYADVRSIHLARGPADRLRGLPVLVLGLDAGETVRIASLEGTGALHELSRSLGGSS